MIRYANAATGTRLAVEVRGHHTPPVVFVSGVQDDRTVWDAVTDHLDETTCTYDRPGLGRSERYPDSNTRLCHGCNYSADELNGLLSQLDVPTPRILVGHSIGALIAASLAARHPQDCAGTVLVDPSEPTLFTDTHAFEPSVSDGPGGTCFDWHRLAAEFAALQIPAVPSRVVSSAPGRWLRESQPHIYSPLSLADVDARWQRWQAQVANRMHGKLLVAPVAGHRVHVEDPALVAQAIAEVAVTTRQLSTSQLRGSA